MTIFFNGVCEQEKKFDSLQVYTQLITVTGILDFFKYRELSKAL